MMGLAIPFRIKNGRVLTSYDRYRIKEKVKAILNIVAGEYFLDPKMGVANWLFSPMSPIITQSIKEQFVRYIPEIEIEELNFFYEEPGAIVISLKYKYSSEEESVYVYKTI